MESIIKNLTVLKGNDVCLECNEPKPTWVSFPTAIFICGKCAKEHKSFSKNQNVKSIEVDSFSPIETRMLSLGGNKRFKKILDDYSISLNEPSMEYKYLTIAVHYYISLLKLDVDKFTGKAGANEEYQKLINEKPIYEIGAELYSNKEINKQEIQPINDNTVSQPLHEIEEVEQKTETMSSSITNAIGGLFGYFSSAVKATTQYVGIDGHIETAKNKINETMEYYGINDAVKNTSSKVIDLAKGAGDYIYTKGKEVSEMQIVKDTVSKVGEGVQVIKDKTNEFINMNNGEEVPKKEDANEGKISNEEVPQNLRKDF